MLESLSHQMASVALTAAGGAGLALAWDLYRVLKAALGVRHALAVALCDLAFTLVSGLGLFVFLLSLNGAAFHLATFVGLAAGATVYRWAVSPLVLWALWILASMGVIAMRSTFSLVWWLARRPRPWGTL